MYEDLITEELLFRMIEDGALIPKEGSEDPSFLVDFAIVNEKYPQYLETLIEQTLNIIEFVMWKDGFVHYSILDNGMLEWHVTPKGRKAAQKLNDTT